MWGGVRAFLYVVGSDWAAIVPACAIRHAKCAGGQLNVLPAKGVVSQMPNMQVAGVFNSTNGPVPALNPGRSNSSLMFCHWISNRSKKCKEYTLPMACTNSEKYGDFVLLLYTFLCSFALLGLEVTTWFTSQYT